MSEIPHYDVLVIGGGPSGQKAAIQAAKAGKRVLIVERDRVGGECVHRGTIPSKTLRESAVYLAGLRARTEGLLDTSLGECAPVAPLMRKLRTVLEAHEQYLGGQLERNEVDYWRGRAHFLDAHRVTVTGIHGKREVTADIVILATGSKPRRPDNVEIDHEHVLDSDSILSLIYLPKTLTVLGAGVIACEFASVFQTLGVEVTMVDKYARPLGFLDRDLTERFQASFERIGGCFRGEEQIVSAAFNGVDGVDVELASGEVIRSEKVLCALGRVAAVEGLGLENAGIELTDRGVVRVDEHCRTVQPGVYAVGDVIGPPALATTAVEQGRRAVRHALGLPADAVSDRLPVGIYTLPELACVGLTEAQAVERYGSALVGRANFGEIARGHINGDTEGLLKLVCEPETGRLVGAHVVCEDATELVHLAQIAMTADLTVWAFVENIFNFPTRAEAYRVAALDILGRNPGVARKAA